jgi:RHS repeat-associated protein
VPGIQYNHLNLPWKINVKNKGTISYLYDAAGNKLEKLTNEPAATSGSTKTTSYIAGFVYENNLLQFFGQEEGRIRLVPPVAGGNGGTFAFDYFIKDHLGNTRMVLSDEVVPDAIYQASMEDNKRAFEIQLFNKIPDTEAPKPATPSPGFDSDGANQKVSKLFNVAGGDKRIGPGVVLKVMAGDKFNAKVFGWYPAAATDNAVYTGAGLLVNSLINALSGNLLAAGSKGTLGELSSTTGVLNAPLSSFINDPAHPYSAALPKAYLNWVLLDEQQFKYVSNNGNSGAVQIPAIAAGSQKQLLQANAGNDITVAQNGYLYVYVSNESQGSVYFDDLRVEHKRGVLIEETHYYPFGLTMAGISSTAQPNNTPNRLKYNGYEQQSKEFSDGSGLEWYDYKHRFYDNQIGRFFVQDRLATEYVYYSPYQFAGNEVPNAIDLDGLEPYYANPRQIFYHAAEKITFKVANLIDMVSYKAEAGVTFIKNIFSSGSTTIASETTAKGSVEIQPTFTSALGKIKASPEPTSDFSLFSFNVNGEISQATVVKSDLGVVSVKEEVSINNLGVIQNKTSGDGKAVLGGIPLTFSLSSSNSSNLEKDRTAGVSLSPNSNTKLGIQFKETKKVDNTHKAEATIRGEVSTPGKTGVKVFGGFSLTTYY